MSDEPTKICPSCNKLLSLESFYLIRAKGESSQRYEKTCKFCKKSLRNPLPPEPKRSIEPDNRCPKPVKQVYENPTKHIDFALWERLRGDILQEDEKNEIEINLRTLIQLLAEERFRQTGAYLESNYKPHR